ncbi:MAG: formylglycine-generating enzyme family protein, partial [Deinococcota bacterium]
MSTPKSCCQPARVGSEPKPHHAEDVTSARNATSTQQAQEVTFTPELVHISGGDFLMGSTDPSFPDDHEGPVRQVEVDSFWISPFSVTNADFQQFITATDYVTEAERFGWSYVFYMFLPTGHPPTQALQGLEWWRQVYGATWDHPEGPTSTIHDRLDHPAVHISWNDANAFCEWAGVRLLTEVEWEYAARGGLEQKRYPWGDRLVPNKQHKCNIWQGTFPSKNTCKDGYVGTAPVTSYDANGYGLYNMSGNVWEWCQDLWDTSEIPVQHLSFHRQHVVKGGSYLC